MGRETGRPVPPELIRIVVREFTIVHRTPACSSMPGSTLFVGSVSCRRRRERDRGAYRSWSAERDRNPRGTGERGKIGAFQVRKAWHVTARRREPAAGRWAWGRVQATRKLPMIAARERASSDNQRSTSLRRPRSNCSPTTAMAAQ